MAIPLDVDFLVYCAGDEEYGMAKLAPSAPPNTPPLLSIKQEPMDIVLAEPESSYSEQKPSRESSATPAPPPRTAKWVKSAAARPSTKAAVAVKKEKVEKLQKKKKSPYARTEKLEAVPAERFKSHYAARPYKERSSDIPVEGSRRARRNRPQGDLGNAENALNKYMADVVGGKDALCRFYLADAGALVWLTRAQAELVVAASLKSTPRGDELLDSYAAAMLAAAVTLVAQAARNVASNLDGKGVRWRYNDQGEVLYHYDSLLGKVYDVARRAVANRTR